MRSPVNHAHLRNCDGNFSFSGELFEQVPLVINNDSTSPSSSHAVSTTVQSLVDTRQINREKVIAETYWQNVFDEEKQKKT
jgi:hypothetical protein